MSGFLVMSLDEDLAGHLAVALRRHQDALRRKGMRIPPQLAELERAALTSVGNRHGASRGSVVVDWAEDGSRGREYLTRSDIRQLTGASLSTIDRWISSGKLPSSRQGRVRRVARADLDLYLAAAA